MLQAAGVIYVVFHEWYFINYKNQEGGFYLFLFIAILLRTLASEMESHGRFRKALPYVFPILGLVFCFIDLRSDNVSSGTRFNVGVMFYVNLTFTLILLAFFLTQQRILNKKLSKKIENKQARIIQLIRRNRKDDMRMIINTVERERSRFSTELEDRVGQILVTAKVNVDLLSSFDKREVEGFKNTLSNSNLLITMAMEEVKSISHSLMPRILTDLGFCDAVREICDRAVLKNGSHVTFEFNNGQDIRHQLNSEEWLHLYRIIQESVSNIVRHSSATSARIKLRDMAESIQLDIEDNGCGFRWRNSERGAGLKTIENRAEVIDAKVSIESELQKGTHISVEIERTKSNNANES